jgi:hypothetical protein
MLGHLFIPHVNKSTAINITEVKPVRTRHIQTQVNDTMLQGTWSISMGNNVGKAGTENTFIYTIRWRKHLQQLYESKIEHYIRFHDVVESSGCIDWRVIKASYLLLPSSNTTHSTMQSRAQISIWPKRNSHLTLLREFIWPFGSHHPNVHTYLYTSLTRPDKMWNGSRGWAIQGGWPDWANFHLPGTLLKITEVCPDCWVIFSRGIINA